MTTTDDSEYDRVEEHYCKECQEEMEMVGPLRRCIHCGTDDVDRVNGHRGNILEKIEQAPDSHTERMRSLYVN